MLKYYSGSKHFFSIMLFVLMLNSPSIAQNHNALSFDGINDGVDVLNGSGLIANSSQMSLTVWAKPVNSVLTFPNFNGYAGIRKDSSGSIVAPYGDFYLVQLGSGNLEGRFRNTNGDKYTVTIPGVQANVWQHFALIYNGTDLSIYANGNFAGSIPASGVITTTTLPFTVGYLNYPGNNYYTEGLIDDVSLWNKALTPAEIACIMQFGPDLTDPALKLSFSCNQGLPAGNNTGITSLIDQSGHINGTFNGMALNGGISNFVTGQVVGQTTFDALICQGGSYTFDGQVLTVPGTYFKSYTAANGCDSTVVVTLAVTSVDKTVLSNGSLFASLETAASSYQWVNCNNNYSIIPNATSSNFIAPAPGSYAVILTKGSCIDTSGCHTYVVPVSISESLQDPMLNIHPNPAKNTLHFVFEKIMQSIAINIYSIQGKWLFENRFNNKLSCDIDLGGLNNGLFIAKISTNKGNFIKLFEKFE